MSQPVGAAPRCVRGCLFCKSKVTAERKGRAKCPSLWTGGCARVAEEGAVESQPR